MAAHVPVVPTTTAITNILGSLGIVGYEQQRLVDQYSALTADKQHMLIDGIIMPDGRNTHLFDELLAIDASINTFGTTNNYNVLPVWQELKEELGILQYNTITKMDITKLLGLIKKKIRKLNDIAERDKYNDVNTVNTGTIRANERAAHAAALAVVAGSVYSGNIVVGQAAAAAAAAAATVAATAAAVVAIGAGASAIAAVAASADTTATAAGTAAANVVVNAAIDAGAGAGAAEAAANTASTDAVTVNAAAAAAAVVFNVAIAAAAIVVGGNIAAAAATGAAAAATRTTTRDAASAAAAVVTAAADAAAAAGVVRKYLKTGINDLNAEKKYLKYKQKYLKLKNKE